MNEKFSMLLFFFSLSLQLNDYIIMLNIPPDANKFATQQIHTNAITKAKSHLKPDEKITKKFMHGYLANLSEETAKMIENDSETAIIEEDKEVEIADFYVQEQINNWSKFSPSLEPFLNTKKKQSSYDIEQNIFQNMDKYYQTTLDNHVEVQDRAPWGISRVSNGESFDSPYYKYPSSAGENVDVYVIDTGIEITHPQFHGKAIFGANFVEGSKDTDENGHGTHCAGVIAGKNVGIAKKAQLIAVKVMDKLGVGRISRVILGIDFVIRSHSAKMDELYQAHKNKFNNEKYTETEIEIEGDLKEFMSKNFLKNLTDFLKVEEIRPKSVVNMSVGGLRSRAFEFAIDYATKLGIHFAVAAGNDHEDACMFSPGSSKNAFTVGASTKDDTIAFFSNIGKCVDIYAPGMEITSAWINNKMKIASGTSMAAPHVAGVMALYLGMKNYSPDELKNKLLNDSYNVIEDIDESDSLDFWPIKHLFGKNKNKYGLVSIKKLNDCLEEENN